MSGEQSSILQDEKVIAFWGDCIFDSVNAATEYFNKQQLPVNDRFIFRDETQQREAEFIATAGTREALGGSLQVTVNMLLEKLDFVGLHVTRLKCHKVTVPFLEKLDSVKNRQLAIESVEEGKFRVVLPAIIYIENESEDTVPHTVFCSTGQDWARYEEQDMEEGDKARLIMELAKK